MRRYQLGAHTKIDLQVHVVWSPQYRKRVLTGHVALRVGDLLRQSAVEPELEIITGKVARDPVQMFLQSGGLTKVGGNFPREALCAIRVL